MNIKCGFKGFCCDKDENGDCQAADDSNCDCRIGILNNTMSHLVDDIEAKLKQI